MTDGSRNGRPTERESGARVREASPLRPVAQAARSLGHRANYLKDVDGRRRYSERSEESKEPLKK